MRRILLIAVVFGGALPAQAAQADPYRWCVDYGSAGGDGGSNCYFLTLAQCRAAALGNRGFCRPNPFYTGPDNAARPSGRARGRQSHE